VWSEGPKAALARALLAEGGIPTGKS
jgi:hypothetical protein